MRSLAWRSLSAAERAVYVEIAFHYTGENNGRIVISVRGLATSLGISKDTSSRVLKVLEDRGFIEVVKRGEFRMKQCHASEFRMTAFRCDTTGSLPTKKFMSWMPEIQITVRPQGRNGTTTGTDGTKATRNYPSRSLPSDCQSPFAATPGPTTGTHLESTIGGVRAVRAGENGATAQASLAATTARIQL